MAALKVAVYCGSASGSHEGFAREARHLGRCLADAGIGMVYGGAAVGLMGTVADAVLAAGGEVVGVLPQHLADREIAHTGLTRLQIVPDMHSRKALMAELSDAFIALPGGFGTLEELFEVLTWAAIGMHRKPVGLLNSCEYYTPLLDFLGQSGQAGFIRPDALALLHSHHQPQGLLAAMRLQRNPGYTL
ncbi:TIGR00730 family Rossman fold protein [Spirochaeta africana]|uniref:Cytokinin riboside 5'-monophosphate phosphoribohydrolase n=1 Tax=Spirochaeta africana (strain ATCC 700263 / DSM 8902 / Z-7692) TaxID=889378 RepID=H9UIJ9_SPIAZ|nr:TIGR00730 family Rossman fold protein [Spirochaeta africana]AFG37342.1 TIGR00730 family protein [Spirochaeta africana DSM 8902]